MMADGKKIDPDNYSISAKASISGNDISIGQGVCIEDGVEIDAKKISIGPGTRIERDTVIRGLSGRMDEFVVGDECLIAFANQILTPDFKMGDYSQLHNSGLSSGYKPLEIGHNCWIGQRAILNCTEKLTIKNNVRIGTGSQLWTHVASGEILEGCTLLDFKPLVLEDNVWIVGGAVISPGLTVAKNSIVMTGAVLTKSTEPFHTYAGIPARDVTDKLDFWKQVSLDNKTKMIDRFIKDFLKQFPHYKEAICFVRDLDGPGLKKYRDKLVLTTQFSAWQEANDQNVSVFDITSKFYLKQRSRVEIDWIRWSVGYRARFIPFPL